MAVFERADLKTHLASFATRRRGPKSVRQMFWTGRSAAILKRFGRIFRRRLGA
jgi:hypothetical protein